LISLIIQCLLNQIKYAGGGNRTHEGLRQQILSLGFTQSAPFDHSSLYVNFDLAREPPRQHRHFNIYIRFLMDTDQEAEE